MTKPLSDYILFVEDEEADQFLTQEFLRRDGIINDVIVVNDGIEALAFLESVDPLPNFVLLDLMLPKMDGFETLRRIRASDRLKDLIVIILTVSNDPKAVERIYAERVDGFLVKPIRPIELIKILPEIGKKIVIK